MSKLFSYNKDANHIVLRILGIRLSLRNDEFLKNEKEIQDGYDLSNIRNAKKLIVFLIPDKKYINGGILSIYSICKYSRKICPDAECLICTVPGKYTYSHNPYFTNEEKVYRWEQVVENIKNVQGLILHIPEYFADKFYSSLSNAERKILKAIPDLHINILNQNIELMPPQKKIDNLYRLTDKVTQTIGHDRYASPEICQKWAIKSHFLSVYIDASANVQRKKYDFDKKEKIIVLSPDKHPMRDSIVEILKKEMLNFRLVTVENLKYNEYIDLIARSYFTITFGEGFDGYFNQPMSLGSVSFAVYNDEFFPDATWKELENVYSSYEEMKEKIAGDMKRFLADSCKYYEVAEASRVKTSVLYSKEKFLSNLENFYRGNYILS